MRISELSDQTGVSTATIKYYVRIGILHAGQRRGHNITVYDESHVARLRLVRALIEQGGLSVCTVGEVLAAADDPAVPLLRVLGIAQMGTIANEENPSEASRQRVLDIVEEQGWLVHPQHPAIAMAASALDAFEQTGRADLSAALADYAKAADLIAESDLRITQSATTRERAAEAAVLATVVGDRLFAGLRRLAQSSHHRRALPQEADKDCSSLREQPNT